MKIMVLCGGESAERVVSWASGDAVASWLVEAGYSVVKYDPEQAGKIIRADEPLAPPEIGMAAPRLRTRESFDPLPARALLEVIEREKPDVVFPILHGGRGEDGTLQALLEWAGVCFTGSGALACGMAMNKFVSAKLFRTAGIPVAEHFVVPFQELKNAAAVSTKILESIHYPVVVKPLYGGSTVGLNKVYEADDLSAALDAVHTLHDDALVEDLFEGRELTCTVVDGIAYPLIEIRPKDGFYDYSNKYTAGRTDYFCPAPIADEIAKKIQHNAVLAFEALGCRGFSRIDFLLNEQGEFICLEVNTLPGMTKHSLVPKAARAYGIEPPELMRLIVENARRGFQQRQ